MISRSGGSLTHVIPLRLVRDLNELRYALLEVYRGVPYEHSRHGEHYLVSVPISNPLPLLSHLQSEGVLLYEGQERTPTPEPISLPTPELSPERTPEASPTPEPARERGGLFPEISDDEQSVSQEPDVPAQASDPDENQNDAECSPLHRPKSPEAESMASTDGGARL